MTIYINMKTPQGIETIDEFTRGSDDAPANYREFRKYVNKMLHTYSSCYPYHIYKSSRSTKDWRESR